MHVIPHASSIRMYCSMHRIKKTPSVSYAMHHLSDTKAAYMYPHAYSILVFYTTEVNSTNSISKTAQSPQKVCTYNLVKISTIPV